MNPAIPIATAAALALAARSSRRGSAGDSDAESEPRAPARHGSRAAVLSMHQWESLLELVRSPDPDLQTQGTTLLDAVDPDWSMGTRLERTLGMVEALNHLAKVVSPRVWVYTVALIMETSRDEWDAETPPWRPGMGLQIHTPCSWHRSASDAYLDLANLRFANLWGSVPSPWGERFPLHADQGMSRDLWELDPTWLSGTRPPSPKETVEILQSTYLSKLVWWDKKIIPPWGNMPWIAELFAGQIHTVLYDPITLTNIENPRTFAGRDHAHAKRYIRDGYYQRYKLRATQNKDWKGHYEQARPKAPLQGWDGELLTAEALTVHLARMRKLSRLRKDLPIVKEWAEWMRGAEKRILDHIKKIQGVPVDLAPPRPKTWKGAVRSAKRWKKEN